jgi:hypothetical protein
MANTIHTRRSTDLVIEDLVEENVRLWDYVTVLKDELARLTTQNAHLRSEVSTRREMFSVAVEHLAVVAARERTRVKARAMSACRTPRLDPMDLRCASCGATNIAGASPQVTQEDDGTIDCSVCGWHTSDVRRIS